MQPGCVFKLNKDTFKENMDNVILLSFLAVILVSVISLIGVASFMFSAKALKFFSGSMVGLAVGALFGDVFIHIIPELIQDWQVFSGFLIVVGILIFALIERLLHWHHHHASHNDCEHTKQSPTITMLLIGDAVHNFIDGALIAASFLVSIELGIATTIAVIIHEIPQEISDFGALIALGVERKKALFLNFITALTAILGVVIVLIIGDKSVLISQILLPITAGGFIYVAGTDLLPELKTQNKISSIFWHTFYMILGVGLMALLLLFE